MNSADVLLTYAWCRTSYVALRSLTEMGLKVVVADEGGIGMCQYSNLKENIYLYRSPLLEPDGFIDDILEIIDKTGAKFLFPSHDETEVLARYRDRLPKDIILPVNACNMLEFANNKYEVINFAKSIGLSVPKTYDYDQIDDLSNELNNREVVVKLRTGNSSKGVFFTEAGQTFEQIQKIIDRYNLSHDRYPILQDRVEGEGWGVSCLYWQGKRIASFTHKRLKEKLLNGGTSTLRISQKNDLIEKEAHELLSSLNWHGLAMVEFKYDTKSNTSWLIEINPRLWGSIELAIKSGVDFPKLLYLAATAGPDEARKHVSDWKEGIKAQWVLGFFIRYPSLIKNRRFRELFKFSDFFNADTYDDFKKGDFSAFVGEVFYYGAKFLRTGNTNPLGGSNVG